MRCAASTTETTVTLTLLIGGARSGKSSLAVDIGHRHHAAGIAGHLHRDRAHPPTATPIPTWPSGSTVTVRERPAAWATIEEEVDLVGALSSVGDGLAIIDCLTLWTSNLMWRELGDDEIRTRAAAPRGRRGRAIRADRGDHQRGRTRRPP